MFCQWPFTGGVAGDNIILAYLDNLYVANCRGLFYSVHGTTTEPCIIFSRRDIFVSQYQLTFWLELHVKSIESCVAEDDGITCGISSKHCKKGPLKILRTKSVI